MRFESWWYLLLLVLIPIFHRVWKKRNQPAAVQFSMNLDAAAPQKRGVGPVSKLLFIRYLAIALAVVALARPQTSFQQLERSVSGIDIVLVLDVSASMDIEDLAETPRIDVAKATLKEFVKSRKNDRIGFVIFSGEPLTMAPPTLDYGLVTQAIDDARIGVLKDGTAIGDGLALAVSRLKDSKAKSRVIVLMTDGDNNQGQVDPATAGELAAGFGLKVYTVAIGREGRVKLPIRQKTPFGNTVTTYQWFDNALNPELLQKIAESTHSKFYRVTDADTLKKVYQEIDQLEKTEVKTKEKVHYTEEYEKILRYALLALLAELILSLGWWRVLP